MKLTLVDQVVLYAYLLGIVLFGLWFSRKNRSSRHFMDAGGALSGWVVGLSLFGTYLSSISFLANPGKSFDSNWSPFVFSLSLPIAALIAVTWFVPFYRRRKAVSAYAHLEERFGSWASNYAIGCYVITQTVRIGAILLLAGMAAEPILGVDIRIVILVLGIAVIVYTLAGGIEAVIWTDVVQSVVLTVGIVVAIVAILAGMPEGPKQVFEIAREAVDEHGRNKFSLGSFSSSLQDRTFWVVLVYGLVINLQNFGIDQTYVQRYATAKDEGAARRSVWLACWLYLPISALLFFVGTGLFAFYSVHPELVPDDFSGDRSFAHFIANELPTGLVGLLMAAMLAAAMSSVDSSLNSCATLICSDLAPRFSGGLIRDSGQQEESDRRILRGATVLIGGIGILIALGLVGTDSILDTWWIPPGIIGGGMLVLFLLGMLSHRIRGLHAAIGVVAGLFAIAWMSLSTMEESPLDQSLHLPFDSFLTIVLGTMVILLVGFLSAQVFPGRSDGDKDW